MSKHVWTWQTKEICDYLKKGDTYYPQFELTQFPNNAHSQAYLVLLSAVKYHYQEAKGMVFSIGGSLDHSVLHNKKDYYSCIEDAGKPSGVIFPEYTHKLLHLVVPDKYIKVIVDFYRYSDLIYSFLDPKVLSPFQAIDCLYTPNSKHGFELEVCHLPFIKPYWVVEEE